MNILNLNVIQFQIIFALMYIYCSLWHQILHFRGTHVKSAHVKMDKFCASHKLQGWLQKSKEKSYYTQRHT